MKIMIVDDDPVCLTMLEKCLPPTGHTLFRATTGSQAWDRFKQEQPRIVISDWMMPGLTGLELCRKIRACQTADYTYVIIMTAKDRQEDVLAAFSAGADDYMAKPYDKRILNARIDTGLRVIQLEDGHKLLQKTLVNSRNKIRTVFDALSEEILTVNRDLKVESLNQAALAAMKGTFDEHVDTICCRLQDDGESDFYSRQAPSLARTAFETGEKQVVLDRFKRTGGEEIVKERIVLPVMGDNRHVRQVIFVSRDITETHRHHEEVNHLNRRLKRVSSELIKKNVKLEKTLDNLERTQAQMLQSEKMASIGQLAAGVAHEINNPTGFVSSNLKTLGDYQQDLNRVIGDYQKLKAALRELPDGQLPQAVTDRIMQVDAVEEEVDIGYIQEDVGDLIGDCREGTERIKKIVNDLKCFAHPGEDKVKETDINAGLESTLNVVYNELKYKATIVKELGDVPIIHAHPQQLNQVFMNILVNAAQAIEKSGEIRIATATVDGKVEIRISDTGCGIPEANLNKIFDPFFTTKEVGSGTGLGMNIAYNIICKHGGDIRVESTVGEGTAFIIQLPVQESLPAVPPADEQAVGA